uniref:TFIIS helical bundle-like domain containing protein, putative n=1 Tax=Theileria annulata TaxID=5874 RepID=A0A3B0NHU0_THEAN
MDEEADDVQNNFSNVTMFSEENESPKNDPETDMFQDSYVDPEDRGFDVKVPFRTTKKKTKKSLKKLDEDFVPAQSDFRPDLDDFIDADFEEKTQTKKPTRGTGKTYFDEVIKRVKDRKRHNTKLSDEECQLHCRQLVERMISAASEDVESLKNGKPGLAKLKMLNSLSDINKPSWRQWCISEGVAVALASWLAPLSDGSLPNLSVRTKVLEIALQLPFQPSDLRDNDLGRIIVSLWNHPDETDSNRTLIRSIVQKWTRPMLGIATSYSEIQDSFVDSKPIVTSDSVYKDRKFDPKRVSVTQERIKSKLSQMYRNIESKHKTPGKATRVKITGGMK